MPDSLTTAPPGDNPTLPACTLQTVHPRASHLLWMQEPEVQGHKKASVSAHIVLSEQTPPPGVYCPDAIYCSFMTFLIPSALCILKAHFCTTLSPILFISSSSSSILCCPSRLPCSSFLLHYLGRSKLDHSSVCQPYTHSCTFHEQQRVCRVIFKLPSQHGEEGCCYVPRGSREHGQAGNILRLHLSLSGQAL